ncbi:MAG: hypothetical protein AB8B55_16035 [Mariniblastus sp.]
MTSQFDTSSHRRILAIIGLAILSISISTFSGCGSSNPTDAELDRVPAVPPSGRASAGAVAKEPSEHK